MFLVLHAGCFKEQEMQEEDSYDSSSSSEHVKILGWHFSQYLCER